MDEIWVACPQCQVNAAYPVQLAGQPVACRQCAKAFQLPETSQISQQEEALPDAIEDDGQHGEPLRYEDLPVTVNRRGVKADGKSARGTEYYDFDGIIFNVENMSCEDIGAAVFSEFSSLRHYHACLSRPTYRQNMGEKPLRVELTFGREATAIADFGIELNLGRPVVKVYKYWQQNVPFWERTYVGERFGYRCRAMIRSLMWWKNDYESWHEYMRSRLSRDTNNRITLFHLRVSNGLRKVINQLGLRDD